MILHLPTALLGQALNDSLMSTFYNKTISHYFADTSIVKRNTKFENILLQTDFESSQLLKNFNKNKFTYFTSKIDLRSFLKKPFKKNNGRTIYRISHTVLDKDTIDVNISGSELSNVTRKALTINIWCSGDMGYIPAGRFIFDQLSESWTFRSSEEIRRSLMTNRREE